MENLLYKITNEMEKHYALMEKYTLDTEFYGNLVDFHFGKFEGFNEAAIEIALQIKIK